MITLRVVWHFCRDLPGSLRIAWRERHLTTADLVKLEAAQQRARVAHRLLNGARA